MRRLSQTKLRLIACAWYFGTLGARLYVYVEHGV